MRVCVSLCVCVLSCNLGDSLVSLLFEPIAGKNASPDEQLWRFLKKTSYLQRNCSVKPY